MKENFKDILFIGPENLFGGIGAVLRTYQKSMHHFNFIATHKDQNKFFNLVFFIFSIFKIIFFLLTNHHIKIVHIHSASKGSFIRKMIISLIVKIFNKKVIFHMHGGQFKEYYNQIPFMKPLFNFILNKLDLFICLTQEWKEFFEVNLGLKNVIILGNPIELSNESIFKPFTNSIKILFLGSINNKKGIFELLDYLETNIHFNSNKINLTIGGNGDVEKLEHKIAQSKYKNQINYLGFVDQQEKMNALSNCDIFILPSYYEGLPVAILEALAYGKPVIATNVGGVPSVIHNQKNGWLIDAGCFGQLDPIFDQIVHQKFSLESYQRYAFDIASKFSTKSVLTELNLEYNKLINRL